MLSNIRNKGHCRFEKNILPNPLRILAEAKDVDDILVDSILVQIQAEARVVSGIWEDQIASNLVSNVLIVQCVMYHNVCIFQLNDSKHWSMSIRMTDRL